MNDSRKDTDKSLEDWLSMPHRLAEQWRNASEEQRAQATRKMAESLWQGVMENGSEQSKAAARQLQDATQAMLAGAGYFLQALTDIPTMVEIPHRAQQMFKAMPLGLMREHHINMRNLTQAMEDHQAVLMRMANAFTELETQAIDLLAKRADTLGDPAGAADNARALYDLWVNCAEEEFAKLAHDPAFIHLAGECVNSSMRLRKQQCVVLEQLLKQFDLPTRAEINTVHRKLRDLASKVDALANGSAAKSAARPKKSAKR